MDTHGVSSDTGDQSGKLGVAGDELENACSVHVPNEGVCDLFLQGLDVVFQSRHSCTQLDVLLGDLTNLLKQVRNAGQSTLNLGHRVGVCRDDPCYNLDDRADVVLVDLLNLLVFGDQVGCIDSTSDVVLNPLETFVEALVGFLVLLRMIVWLDLVKLGRKEGENTQYE